MWDGWTRSYMLHSFISKVPFLYNPFGRLGGLFAAVWIGEETHYSMVSALPIPLFGGTDLFNIRDSHWQSAFLSMLCTFSRKGFTALVMFGISTLLIGQVGKLQRIASI
jgi:hypothetical protein